MLKPNGVYLALIICFNSLTFMNSLHLNKHQPHTVGGSNYKIMPVCKPPKIFSISLLYLHFQNGCVLKNFLDLGFFCFVFFFVTMRSASGAFLPDSEKAL